MVKSRHASAGPSQRQLRVGELVRHALSNVFREGAHTNGTLDTRLLTITEVRMSPDLKIATVFVMPLGGAGIESVTKTLAQHARGLRGELGRQVELKFTPELRFLIDDSFGQGAKIDAILRSPQVQRDIETGEDDA